MSVCLLFGRKTSAKSTGTYFVKNFIKPVHFKYFKPRNIVLRQKQARFG